MEPDRTATAQERECLRAWVRRACTHEPLQYILGEAWFHGRPFEVDRTTLIPRPATESLVDAAVACLGGREAPRVLEVGTGTGCVAVSLIAQLDRPARAEARRRAAAMAEVGATVDESVPAKARTEAWIVATELVAEAADLARRNLVRHSVEHAVEVRIGSLFEPLGVDEQGSFDLVVSNPPYISDNEWAACAANVRDHEPESALRGGQDGLEVIRPLIAGAPAWLKPGGHCLVEMQFDQAADVSALFSEAGFTSVGVLQDFDGHDRVVTGIMPG
jgi:release factor glutamine methyltransferase